LALVWATPEQIHISLTGVPSEMTVMWTTQTDTATSTVLFWPQSNANANRSATGSYTHYEFPPDYRSPAIHRVLLTDLLPDTAYEYVCGDQKDGFSSAYHFTTEPTAPPVPLRIGQIADHGTTNHSVANVNAMLNQHLQTPYAFFLQSGDLSYADGVQPVWDVWGNMVQPLASILPMMVSIGNHELLDLDLAYDFRFYMPRNGPFGNQFFSFEYSLVHFISLSSEEPFYSTDIDPQYLWLKDDLKKVSRSRTPWIIVSMHNPWYCSNVNHYESGAKMRDAYEELFYENKVDLTINGHVHAYQRTYPVYKGNITNDATTYITAGIGGTREGLYNSWHPDPVWSAYHEAEYGFCEISIWNSTHLQWQMRHADDSEVYDSVWIVREH